MEAFSSLQALAGDIEDGLRQVIGSRSIGGSARMYEMLEYFLGYRSETLAEDFVGSGKRFRPVLCLALAEGYGDRERAMPAALAIELFHNFTLIHDDIADHDEVRRNRPTLWKLFGTDHALNSGDALSLLACELAMRTGERALTEALLQAFYEVIEGQYLDFEASRGSPEMSEGLAIETIRKKTGALVRVSAEAAGIAAGRVEDELILLRTFGESLGMAFQIADDFRSVWSPQAQTGKDLYSDIRERKQTLPYVFALCELNGKARERLIGLYAQKGQLSNTEIIEAKALIDSTASKKRTGDILDRYVRKAKDSARFLSLQEDLRHALEASVDELTKA